MPSQFIVPTLGTMTIAGNPQSGRCSLMITAEQAEQAKDIVLATLDDHNQQSVPFLEVLTKPSEDFDGVAFVDVMVVYDGEPSDLDAGILNSYDSFLYMALREAGICALPAVSYIPPSDREKLGTSWTG